MLWKSKEGKAFDVYFSIIIHIQIYLVINTYIAILKAQIEKIWAFFVLKKMKNCQII